MDKTFKVNVRFSESIAILDLEGEINIFAEEKLTQLHKELIEDAVPRILFNFEDVTYINSAGIAIFIGMVSESQEQNQQLAITNLIPHFQRIFEMVGLTQYVKLYDSEEDALNDFGSSTM